MVYKDHNGVTTFSSEVKSWSFAKLKRVFGGKHDVVKLAALLGIPVVEEGDSKPQVEKAKKKKEE